jgi:hypothetical protein
MKAQGYGPVGPIINGVWDLRDASRPVEEGYIIEDMGYPGVLGEVCLVTDWILTNKACNYAFYIGNTYIGNITKR